MGDWDYDTEIMHLTPDMVSGSNEGLNDLMDKTQALMNKVGHKALRYNEGKVELSLIDPGALEELARVLMFGSQKYARDNWKKGLKWTQIIDSMWRHMNKILQGQDHDEETGLLHAAHIMCNAMFLCHHMANEVGEDDRYNGSAK